MADNKLSLAELVDVQKESDDIIAAVLRFKQYAHDRAAQGGTNA